MSASVAIVKHAYDLSNANVWFTVTSDGESAIVTFKDNESEESIRSLLLALNNRIGKTAEWGTPESILSGLFYNFPVTVDIDSDYESMESAISQSRRLIISTNMEEHDDTGYIEHSLVEIKK